MGKINMETLSKQNRQSWDTTSKSPSGLSDNSLFQSENFIQPMTQPSTSALDEASRDAETSGGMGEATFDAHSKHPTRTLSYQPLPESRLLEMHPKKHVLPTEITPSSSFDNKTRPTSKSPPVAKGPSNHVENQVCNLTHRRACA